MRHATFFVRSLFILISIFFITIFLLNSEASSPRTTTFVTLIYGFLITTFILFFDRLLRRITFRLFNLTIVGLIFGYLMGFCLTLIFTTLLDISLFNINYNTLTLFKFSFFICSLYLGIILSYRYSEELCLSIPFIKLQPTINKNKGLILDSDVLADPRIIDLAATGLLDQRLILPRFVINEVQMECQSKDELEQQRAKRTLENIKKLETMGELNLIYKEDDFPKVKYSIDKTIHLARIIDADILTATDYSKIQSTEREKFKIITLHALSKALKPLMQHGEYLTIKVQRLGKEEKQGVGYLEDGTMVVVNGGGDFIGGTIEARVLSVKHTQSGRLVFCNLIEDA